MASSRTTSLEPSRRQIVPAEPRLPSARPSRITGEDTRRAGVDREEHRREQGDDAGERQHAEVQAEALQERHRAAACSRGSGR